jgi:hypothetical protein
MVMPLPNAPSGRTCVLSQGSQIHPFVHIRATVEIEEPKKGKGTEEEKSEEERAGCVARWYPT